MLKLQKNIIASQQVMKTSFLNNTGLPHFSSKVPKYVHNFQSCALPRQNSHLRFMEWTWRCWRNWDFLPSERGFTGVCRPLFLSPCYVEHEPSLHHSRGKTHPQLTGKVGNVRVSAEAMRKVPFSYKNSCESS